MAVVDATIIRSPTGFSWFGTRSEHLPRSITKGLNSQTARSYLHYTLQTRLYRDFYCPGTARAESNGHGPQVASGRTPFITALSQSNAGSGHWAKGWTISTATGDATIIRNGKLTLRARRNEIQTDSTQHIPPPGAQARLLVPKEFTHLSPGFYMAVGDQELAPDDELVRWYWNLTAAGAVPFVQMATGALNQIQVPFKLKVLNDPTRYTRADAAVLYLRKVDIGQIGDTIRRLASSLSDMLKPATPALTKPLADGVGLAEDPGAGTSFGLHRCALLAEGLIRAHELGRQTPAARLEVVANALEAAGIDLDQPYLNPGSKDVYQALDSPSRPNRARPSTSLPQADPKTCLETAEGIGRKIVESAIWYKDRCTWVGAEPTPQSHDQAPSRPVFRTIGADMYSGTAGLALFLAQLYADAGGSIFRNTAVAALTQSFATLQNIPPQARFGLFSGWSGIALAAARTGSLLQEEAWLKRADDLFGRMMDLPDGPTEPDLLAGSAGAIVALLASRSHLDPSMLVGRAARIGDRLLAAAEPLGQGCFWPSISYPNTPGLTGFSHGASGMGFALLELFHATGEAKYKLAALRAFDYESDLFDPVAGNWPDLRGGDTPGETRTFASAWCHGAPGIALARIGAFARLGQDRFRDEAKVAILATAKAVQAGLESEIENYSLCHGMAGNADVLFSVGLWFDPDVQNTDLVHRVASFGIHRYASDDQNWPCGIPWETPGLMLGLAGIGYFYLRLADDDVPSILAPVAQGQ